MPLPSQSSVGGGKQAKEELWGGQAKEELFGQVDGHRHASPLFCEKSHPARLDHCGSTSQADSLCSPPAPSAPASTAPSPG